MPPMMLEVIDLHFDYETEPLLRGVHFALPAGSILHLRGKNGAGKTTLLKLLAGLLPPLSGEIRYQEERVAKQLAWYQQQLCYVGHKAGISLALTVMENIRFDLQLDKVIDLDNLLYQFHLFELKDVACHLLSIGMQRRVGLLRLKLANKKLWLLDEPLVALDHGAVDQLIHCIQEQVQQGGQVIFTSHQSLPLIDAPYQEYML